MLLLLHLRFIMQKYHLGQHVCLASPVLMLIWPDSSYFFQKSDSRSPTKTADAFRNTFVCGSLLGGTQGCRRTMKTNSAALKGMETRDSEELFSASCVFCVIREENAQWHLQSSQMGFFGYIVNVLMCKPWQIKKQNKKAYKICRKRQLLPNIVYIW